MGWREGLRAAVLMIALGAAGCATRALTSSPASLSAEGLAAQSRCDAGDLDACAALGAMYLRGLGAVRDLDAAETVLEGACAAGHVGACADLGEVYVERRQTDASLTEAVRLFDTACERGSSKGCARLGRSLLYGIGVPADIDQAVGLLRSVCQRNDPEGCLTLGGFYMGAGGARTDYGTARPFLEAAVAQGAGHGTLAVMYWQGYGVERDAVRARELMEQGCEQGEASACVNLGIMCQLGEGGPADHQAAVAHFRRACQLGSDRGCSVEAD